MLLVCAASWSFFEYQHQWLNYLGLWIMKMCLSQFENHHHRLRYKTLIWLSCFLTGIWWYWPRNVRKTPDESFCLPGEETGGAWPLLDWDRNCSLFPCSYTACLFPGQRSTLPSGLSRIFVLPHVLFYLMVVHLWLPYFPYSCKIKSHSVYCNVGKKKCKN